VRICQGDSGGPVLWETGFGGYAVGGINSVGDRRNPDDPFLSNQVCMNWGNPDDQLRGESGHAFVPAAFLDRVAGSDPACGGAAQWDDCTGGVRPYGGRRLLFIGTRIEQCGEDKLTPPGSASGLQVLRGGTIATEITNNEFTWYCDTDDNTTTAPLPTRFLVLRRAITDRQTIWDSYMFLPALPQMDVAEVGAAMKWPSW